MIDNVNRLAYAWWREYALLEWGYNSECRKTKRCFTILESLVDGVRLGSELTGGAPTEPFPLIQGQFYAAGRRIWQYWRKSGVDPACLFTAALSDANELRDLIKKVSSDQYARLLSDVAAEIQDADLDRLIRGFLNAIWQSVESQLQLDRPEEAQPLEFMGLVQRMLSRIAHSLLYNPSRFPNRPLRNQPPPDLDTQLDESLL